MRNMSARTACAKAIDNDFFLNFILVYKLNIQIQISLVIGNLYEAGLITGVSSEKMNEKVNNESRQKKNRRKVNDFLKKN